MLAVLSVISSQWSCLRGLPDCSVPCPSLSSTSCLAPVFNMFFIDYLCCIPVICPLSWHGLSMRTRPRSQHPARGRHEAETPCISSRFTCWLRQLQRRANSSAQRSLPLCAHSPLFMMAPFVLEGNAHLKVLQIRSAQALTSSPKVYDSLSRVPWGEAAWIPME